MKWLLPVLALLAFSHCTQTPPSTSTAVSTATAQHTSVTVIVPAQTVALEKTCPSPGLYKAVDLSEPVTQKFLWAMRSLGVKTVIRYYEYGISKPPATIAGKEMSMAELKLIQANGLFVLAVFQHNNSSPATFTSARGTADATRSVALASEWGQPKGSGMYYGVDFEPSKSQLNDVVIYATNFAKVARAAGYKVGVYGSGDTLTMLKGKGLVDYTWVSQSSGFSGTKAYTNSGKWDLLQALPKNCGGINVDFDQAVLDFGQWVAL
jgi:hypothetical protein